MMDIDSRVVQAGRSSHFLTLTTFTGIWSVQRDGRIAFANEAAVMLFGYAEASEIQGQDAHAIAYGRSRPAPHSLLQSIIDRDFFQFKTDVFQHRDGRLFSAECRSTPIVEAGETIGCILAFPSEPQRFPIATENNMDRAFLAATLKGIGDAVITTDASDEPRVTFLNPIAERLTGWTLIEARGRLASEVFPIIHQHSREPAEDPIRRVLTEKKIVGLANHTVLVARDGREFVIEDSAAPIMHEGSIEGVVLVFRDTTERHALRQANAWAQEETENERQKLRSLFEQTPIPMVLLEGPEHRFGFANALYRQYFLEDPHYIGRPLAELIPDAASQGFIDLLDQVYQTGEPFVGKETHFSLRLASGETREFFFDFIYTPVRGREGEIEGIMAAIVDVTEQVLSKAEISMQRAKLETIIAQAPVGMAVYRGENLVFETVNTRFLEMVGSREYLGRTWEDVYKELPDSLFPTIMRQVLATGVPYFAAEAPIRVEIAPDIFEERLYDFHYIRLLNRDGSPYGIFMQCENVTEKVMARKEIEKNAQDLVDTLESMSDAFFSVDRNWIITRMNEHHLKATVLKRDEQMGHSLLDLFFADPVFKDSVYWRSYHKAMEERVFVRFEDYYAPFDLWTEVRVYPKSDGGLAIFFTDISERKANEKKLAFERHQLEAIFQSSPAAMALWRGEDFIFEKVNPEYQKIFAHKHLVDQPLFEVVPELKGQVFEKILRDVLKTGVPFVGHEMKTLLESEPGGTIKEHYYDFSYVRMVDPAGQPYGVYDHAIDVTDRVMARWELEKAKLEAEQANQTKTAFLANMSHEIRTPLGAILGFADMLKDPHLSVRDRDQFLDTILRNGKALTRIIDDILDLAKVEAGKLDVEAIPFSLGHLLEEVVDLFREKAREKNIYLRFLLPRSIPAIILSDPTRLRQILINMIGNAVKFTAEGGVDVNVTADSIDAQHLKLSVVVIDSGVGIETEQRERLFQPFMQADHTTTRKFGGTGLGLALSRRLARALGGDVTWLDTHTGRGAAFELSFHAAVPLDFSREMESSSRSAAPAPARLLVGIHILIVDDNGDNLLLARRILTRQGATVTTADSGVDAIRIAQEGLVDIILMDIHMPGMDGYEATRLLRANAYQKPIIALTAHAMKEEMDRTHAAGCNAHLTKPLNQKALVATIQREMEAWQESTAD